MASELVSMVSALDVSDAVPLDAAVAPSQPIDISKIISADVLILIFEAVVQPTMQLPWPWERYDQERARAPYVLAAVCKSWRRLAIDTSSLWTYFGFEVNKAPQHVFDTRLARSKDAPIDIFFDAGSASRDAGTNMFVVIRRLHELSQRWRFVNIHYPSYSEPYDLTPLTRPTPHLRSLILESLIFKTDDDDDEFEPDPVLFPYAPLFQQMSLDDIARRWSMSSSGVAALSELNIWLYNWTPDTLRSFLEPVATNLRVLSLIGQVGSTDFGHPGSVTVLPKLVDLTAQQAEWLVHIRAPALQRLQLWGSHNDQEGSLGTVSSLQPFADTVQSLVLWGRVSARDLDALNVLSNVTSVHFAVHPAAANLYGAHNDSCYIYSETLAHLAEAKPQIWPSLTRMSFGNEVWPEAEQLEVHLDELEKLVKLRQKTGSGDRTKVEETDFKHGLQLHASSTLQIWVRDAVDRLNTLY